MYLVFSIIVHMKDIKDVLEELGCEEDVGYFLNPSFADAIVGTDYNTGGLIYDYDLMIHSAMEECNWSYDDAVEWIDYNTVRTIPYMKGIKPTIILSRIS